MSACPPAQIRLGTACLLQAIRQFSTAWEQHSSLTPRSETAEEFTARKAAGDALRTLEDCARWLEAGLSALSEETTER